eukprot:11585321-Prorocentrum_lima.AAC.1
MSDHVPVSATFDMECAVSPDRHSLPLWLDEDAAMSVGLRMMQDDLRGPVQEAMKELQQGATASQ